MPSEAKKERDEYGRSLTVFGTPINPQMGEGRWQDALRRMRASIAAGSRLVCDDSDEIGDKYTHCSWGMCSEDPAQWPEVDDHIFPDDFIKRQRIAQRDAPGGCPLDARTGKPQWERYGCFFRCLAFGRGGIRQKDRARVLELYDAEISKREAEHGRKTTADDNEPWVRK